jgi:serine/threonine-protein kinase
VAAAGLAGLGVGSYFGVVAIQKKSQSNDGHCHPDNHCDATGLQLRDDGLHAAAASTALFVVGAAALATGVTLAALPSGPAAEGRVVVGLGHVSLRGTW